MARTEIARTFIPGNLTKNILTWTPGDPVNGLQFSVTGRELLFIRNTNVTLAATFTMFTSTDALRRQANMVNQSVPALTANNGFAILGPFAPPLDNWTVDGGLQIDTTTADLQFAVVQLY